MLQCLGQLALTLQNVSQVLMSCQKHGTFGDRLAIMVGCVIQTPLRSADAGEGEVGFGTVWTCLNHLL